MHHFADYYQRQNMIVIIPPTLSSVLRSLFMMCLGINLFGFYFFPIWASFSFSNLQVNDFFQIWKVFIQFLILVHHGLLFLPLGLRQYRLRAVGYLFFHRFPRPCSFLFFFFQSVFSLLLKLGKLH